jgi:hypothetical protein
MSSLTWKQDGYLYFAHAKEGMYTIEQRAGQFLVTLMLDGTTTDQDMGSYLSLAKAKAGAGRDHCKIAPPWAVYVYCVEVQDEQGRYRWSPEPSRGYVVRENGYYRGVEPVKLFQRRSAADRLSHRLTFGEELDP